MNTIGVGNNVNTMGTHQQSVNCLGPNENTKEPKDFYRPDSEAKSTDKELSEFKKSASKSRYSESKSIGKEIDKLKKFARESVIIGFLVALAVTSNVGNKIADLVRPHSWEMESHCPLR